MRAFYLVVSFLFFLSSCSSNIYYGNIVGIPDGDTIKVKTKKLGIVRVRLLGIDCPELAQEPWGLKAKEFLVNELGENQTIKLETDLVKKDKYGRLLAYVYEEARAKNSYEKISLNEKLLLNGFAKLFIIGENDKYATEFKIAEAKAKAAKINIWDEEIGLKLSPYEFRRKNKK